MMVMMNVQYVYDGERSYDDVFNDGERTHDSEMNVKCP